MAAELTYYEDKNLFVYGTDEPTFDYLPGWSKFDHLIDGNITGFYTQNKYRAYTMVAAADEAAKQELEPIFRGIQEAFSHDCTYVPAEPEYYTCTPEGKTLYPYQLAGVHMIVTRKRVFLGDEPGLGKTIQGICARNIIRPKKTLVICPASLTLNWEREIQEWSTFESSVAVFQGKDLHHVLDHDVVIISDTSITSRIAAFNAIHWDMVIVDEAHRIKNITAERTKVLLMQKDSALRKADYYVLMSGTPSPNRLVELVPFIRYLRPDKMFGAGMGKFKDWFFDKMYNPFSGGFKHASFKMERAVEWRALLYHDWFIRREKADVLTQLPPKQYKLITLDDGHKFSNIISQCEKLDIQDVMNIPSSAMSAVAEIRHAFGIAKAPLVAKYVSDMLEDTTEKIVVFAHHIEVVNILVEKLAKYKPVKIVGGMTTTQKQQARDAFQQDPAHRLIICNLEAGGVGWTLTSAHDVVFAEASYVPGENDQAMDRVHRIGQTEKVVAHFLSVPGTIDFNILKAFLGKQRELKVLNKNAIAA